MWPPALLPMEKPSILVVDDFYARPDDVRAFALEQEFHEDKAHYRGKRSKRFLFPYVRERFQSLLNINIRNWIEDNESANGVFQYCLNDDETVFHSDLQRWAGAVYLTPGAPVTAGTVFYSSKVTDLRRAATPLDAVQSGLSVETLNDATYAKKNLTDPSAWKEVDRVGNVYNRLVLWDARLIHSAGTYFGKDKSDARLFQLFFFDGE